MLKLLMLRHAKSSWDGPDLPDHERPLTKRGTKAAGVIGRYIAENRLAPDQVVSSDSVRTRATCALVAAELMGAEPDTSFHSELYLATPATLLSHIRATDPQTHTLMVVGHNPGIHALSLALIGRGDKKGLRGMAMKFPTSALAVISFKLSNWTNVRPTIGKLEAYVTPRELD